MGIWIRYYVKVKKDITMKILNVTLQKFNVSERALGDNRLERMKRQAMEEAKLRIQQMTEESGFKVDKKQIPPTTEINTEEINIDHLYEEKNVVYIDKNELKDSPQNILNIENSVVYISSSSRAASPAPSHKEEDHRPTLP